MTTQSLTPVMPHVSRFTRHAQKGRGSRVEGQSPITNHAFTLIELLVVIAIIAILAALVVPITGAVHAARLKARTRTEMEQIETAIDRYKAKLGHYPPDNPGRPELNQLYYELMGTTNDGRFYWTLDRSSSIDIAQLGAAFGGNKVSGFVNSTKGGGGDDSANAGKFFPGLKPAQIATTKSGATILVGVPWEKGPAPFDFDPLGINEIGKNPWRYNSSNPTNNPNAYDLWIEVRSGGKTYLICNWSKQAVQITKHDPY